jgi:RNA polymerase sigma-70 factor (ECF subfamily)
LKKSKRVEHVEEAEIEKIPDQSRGVDEEFALREEIERIQSALHDVEEPYREVFMWRVFAELSFRQIGQIFNKTENWACVTYHRARKKILKRLEDKNNEKRM